MNEQELNAKLMLKFSCIDAAIKSGLANSVEELIAIAKKINDYAIEEK